MLVDYPAVVGLVDPAWRPGSTTHRRGRLLRKYRLRPQTRRGWVARLYADDPLCYYCRRPVDRPGSGDPNALLAPTLDHFIPLAAGGLHALSNVVLACRECNEAKAAGAPFVPVDWIDQAGAIRPSRPLPHERERLLSGPVG